MPAAERGAVGRALAIGAAGGWVADLVGLPLAWMLGAIAACAGFGLCGVRLAVPSGLRRMVLAIIGLYLGAAFSPELFAGLRGAPATMAVLFLFSVGLAALLAFGFRRFLPTDALTAYCAGAPGALALMVVLAREKGGDERITALAQIVRVVAVVVVIPLWVRAAADAPPFAPPPEQAADFGALAIALAVLAIGAIAGAITKSAPVYLLAPMALSGALHAADLIDLTLPRAPLNAALVVLGASIGARFGGGGAKRATEPKQEPQSAAERRNDDLDNEVNPTEGAGAKGAMESKQESQSDERDRPDNLADETDPGGGAALEIKPGRTLLAAAVAALVAVVAAALTAYAAAALLDESFWKMLLILAPGGIAEMCLIAVVLDIEPPVVALHQAARVAALLALSPLIAARLARKKSIMGSEIN